MNVRSMLTNIFGKEEKQYKTVHTFKMLNDDNSTFYNWNGKLYDSSTIRTAVGTNAIHAGKLNPKHIRYTNGQVNVSPSDNIKHLLRRPNMYMNMFDFNYKMMAQRELNNNAFAYIDRDKNVPGMLGIKGIYPLEASRVEVLEDDDNNIYLKFIFQNGLYKIAPYTDVIHIRKHFNDDDFWGASNTKTLNPKLETQTITEQGIQNAVKNTAFIRGILKFKQVLQQDDIDKNVKDFSERYLDISNNKKGLAYSDPRYEFQETKAEPFVPNKAQMDYTKQEIYEYFNTNEKIIRGNYNESEWTAYFEVAIEPYAIQSSLEWTEKLFTPTERAYGNEVVFEANRLANASNSTKITICKDLKHLFTVNEQREIWNMAPVEGGDKRLQSLNDVNADVAEQYQLGKKEEENSNE